MTRRVIYVPGMKPKPPADVHREQLCRCLAAGLARSRPDAAHLLTDEPSCLTLISWTYPFYGSHRDIALDLPGIERILAEPEPSAAEIAEIESLARKVRRLIHLLGDALPLYGRLVARPELRVTMAEARRYLCNHNEIATEIRDMLKQPLREAWDAGEEVLLVAHSMGSVIAYDTLWELAHEDHDSRRVDLFVTLGSPLASHFIRQRLLGRNLRGSARYPTNIKRWENFAARAEMTALRPRLARYFGEMQTLGLLESLVDHTDIYNHFHGVDGLNVHMSYGYLVNNSVAGTIADWLLATETTASAKRS